MTLAPLRLHELLRRHDLRPKKGLGQNFLADDSLLARLVEAAQVTNDDNVLEIGPGIGSLTRHLAAAASRVVAVELDSSLMPVLREVLAPWPNVRLVQGDILNLDPQELMGGEAYLVVANIPYYITSNLLRHLLTSSPRPKKMVLTIQQEVARRVCAPAGSLSLLALSVQVFGQPSIVMEIPAGAFYPPPKVNSAVLKVELYDQPAIPEERLDDFFALAKAGFSQRRKTLRNTLSAGLRLTPAETARRLGDAGIDPMRRAETLTLAEWDTLTGHFPLITPRRTHPTSQ